MAKRKNQKPEPKIIEQGMPPAGVPPVQTSAPVSGYTLPLAIAVLLAVTLLVYSRPLSYGFLRMDDELYVYNNLPVKSGLTADSVVWAFTHQAVGNWHPLTMLSLMLDCQVSACSPVFFHAVNIGLHLLGTLCLILALWRLSGAAWPSFFAGAVYALHPTHVESVAWISERKDVLSGLCLALLLLAYANYVKRLRGRSYAWVALWLALGLMCKPMLVSVPLLLLLIDYWPLGRMPAGGSDAAPVLKRRLWEKVPLLGLCALSAAATMIAQERVGAVNSWDVVPLSLRVVNALLAYAKYLGKFFWPMDLAGLYPVVFKPVPGWQPLAAFILLAGVSAWVIWRGRRYPFMVTGWFWFVISLVPVIGLIQVGSQALADRYTYIPYIGLSIAAAWGWPLLGSRLCGPNLKRATPLLTAAVIAAMAAGSWCYLPHWKNDLAFWGRVVAVQPDYARGYYNLALALATAGDNDAAAETYLKALKADPGCIDANYNLGVLYLSQGKAEKAAAHFAAEISMNPKHANAHNNLGVALGQLGRREEALQHFRAAIEADPHHMDALNNLGSDLLRHEQWAAAQALYENALKANPEDINVYAQLAAALEGQGKTAEAQAVLQRAVTDWPQSSGAVINRGAFESRRGDHAAAERYFRRALELDPNSVEARYDLALTLKTLGRADDAAAEYRRLLAASPEHYWAHNDLGIILGEQGKRAEARLEFEAAIKINPAEKAAPHNLELFGAESGAGAAALP